MLKYIAKATIPYLYESVIFYTEEMLGLDDLTQKIEFCYNDNIRFTRNICHEALLTHNLREHCPNYNLDMPETFTNTINIDDGVEACLKFALFYSSRQKLTNLLEADIISLDPSWGLSLALTCLLDSLEENKHWSLNHCYPFAISFPPVLTLLAQTF